ncbi:MAG TPA: amidase family protein [Actinomycetota bacterium]|nr:amidase family protein [Actinomycetota bacterium]
MTGRVARADNEPEGKRGPDVEENIVPARARRLALVPLLAVVVAVPGLGQAAADPDCMVEIGGINLQTATVPQIQQALADGQLTSRQLVERYLQRIAFFDASGASLNSVRELHPAVLEQADRLDAERAAGTIRGPLHGIPVLLKDNIGTNDMPTTAGSIALKGSIPKNDAFLTAQLRAAGAIILGKANLSEFANWVDLSMPSGYSSLGGQVINPYRFTDTPSGSSSGSGVAEAMALTTVAVGTETSGSIISPSWANSVVGIKPTLGLISRAGIIPLAESFDTPGPMTRNVTDAAILLGAMTGVDPRDPATAASASRLPPGGDYTAVLHRGGLVGARLGFDASNRPPGERGTVFDRAIADLRAAGAEIVEIDGLDTTSLVGLAEIAAIPNEFKAGLNAYLATEATPPTGVKTLSDIIKYNEQHPEQVKYGQRLLIASDATPGNMTAGIANREAARASARAAIDSTFARYDLDAVISPNATYVNVGASAGYPTITVPAGYTSNGRLPIGLSFLGTAWDEPELLRFAYAYEQHTLRRVPPTAVNPGLFPTGCAAAAA